MELFTDFTKDLKERISSPLLSSFFIAFSVMHWKIFVVLFFKTKVDLEKLGYIDIIDFISKQLEEKRPFYIAIFIALVYTFLFPLIKAGVRSFNAFVRKLDIKWVTKISQESTVPMAKYLELRETFRRRNKALEEVYKQESTLYIKVNELETAIGTEKKNNEQQKKEIESYKATYSENFLDGLYVIRRQNLENILNQEFDIKIENGYLKFLDKQNPASRERTVGKLEQICGTANKSYFSFHLRVLSDVESSKSFHRLIFGGHHNFCFKRQDGPASIYLCEIANNLQFELITK